MRNIKLFIVISLAFVSLAGYARSKKIDISVSENDAIIYANGENMGQGRVTLVILSYRDLTVEVRKQGYLTMRKVFHNKPGFPKPPRTYYFEMEKDDSFEASLKTDRANLDFTIVVNPKLNETEAWKLATQIVTDYFDAIEVSDKETSYMRTSWSVQSFKQNTIRTRFIIKLGDSDPLTYKIKLVSEESGHPETSVKADEKYKEWDRVLRRYKNIITDFSSRMGEK
ncbi:MAG: hypothetical protein GXO88_02340 [Chlorobi bacterium]|nr:hypothetical protein [Chlorobiota bacterium]